MVVLLLSLDKQLLFAETEKMLIVFLVPVLIGLTQFTVHYYDLSGYFIELLILYMFLKGRSMAVVMGLVVLAALNRESAGVPVGMIAVLLLTRYGATRRVAWNIVELAGAAMRIPGRRRPGWLPAGMAEGQGE